MTPARDGAHGTGPCGALRGLATNGASGWREPHALVATAQQHDEWH